MAEDAREIELDETARAPAGLAATRDASRASDRFTAAAGTEDTAAAPLSITLAPPARLTSATRGIVVAAAVLAVVNLVYFVARFLVASDPPALHRAFVGQAHGRFESLHVFDGPYLTLVRMIAIAVLFLLLSIWGSSQRRGDVRVQLIAATGVIAGQYSIAVAVLTSSETIVAARALAAVIYVGLPIMAFGILALFPNGRPVPRWSPYLLPLAVLPFAIQAAIMFRERAYSVPIAAAFFPATALFLGFQWHRYRKRATVRERYQIKWLCYAGAVFATVQAIAVIAVIPLLEDRESVAFPFFRVLFELLLASSYLLGLATLLFSDARYRVFEIDRVINRTIVYASVTLLLVGASAVAFFGLRGLFAGTLPRAAGVAISIAIVFALAAPTRRLIGRWIDRRFYGIALDYEALAAKAVSAAQGAQGELPAKGTAFASYDELALLGRGGMGAVYRAHHADFGVPVALKVMSPKLAGDADAQARFRRESQILEDLQHPNVIPFLASGHEAGLAFIAMQYIEGEDLGAIARRRGPLSLAEVAPLVAHVAAALDLAHSRGVIHRDIKPANVFVEGTAQDPLAARRALVMDFGVARLADDPRAPDASLVGSLPYIAPEQIHDADAVDARADVYALGATAYELVAGRPPFVESTALGLVLAHLHHPVADPRNFAPALPAAAAAAIVKALAKDPADRFESAGAFAAALSHGV